MTGAYPSEGENQLGLHAVVVGAPEIVGGAASEIIFYSPLQIAGDSVEAVGRHIDCMPVVVGGCHTVVVIQSGVFTNVPDAGVRADYIELQALGSVV